MTWRVAKCLEVLLEQLDAQAPNRSKAADGGIGDAAHASRTSDHNPWVRNGRMGVVTARDFTHDPAGGCDCNAFVESLVKSRDPRIKYIIWNRRIINASSWTWRTYTGSNPHTHHAHVSVKDQARLYDSELPWAVTLLAPSGAYKAVLRMPKLCKGSKDTSYVKQLQKLLSVEADGIFGPKTDAAVRKFQQKHGLVADGIVGVYTWDALLP